MPWFAGFGLGLGLGLGLGVCGLVNIPDSLYYNLPKSQTNPDPEQIQIQNSVARAVVKAPKLLV